MFGDFILDFKDQRITGGKPRKIITSFKELQETDLTRPAYGFLSYDFAWEIERLPSVAKDDLGLPKVLFVIPEVTNVDRMRDWNRAPNNANRFEPRNRNRVSNFSKKEFQQTVLKAKEYIKAGDIYQVNLSQRLEVKIKDSPLEIYNKLRQINPSPFASYFDFGDFQIVSCSPERLIKLENGAAKTRPIAGTRPITASEEELLLDPKERAEHIMLVDLERNDLGKACEYGSVHVDETMVIEKYSHVIHIVSNVAGKLRPDKTKFDLIKAMFPGGTITGCPKIRSMEIIEELEPVKRGIYTGSIGYIGNDKMDLNIAIRTILMKGDTAYIQVGAGIVADSDPEREYFETLHKAQAMLEAIA